MPKKPNTILANADHHLNETKSLTQPIYQTSTFVAESADEFAQMATEPRHTQFYARYGTPNHAAAETLIAQLEGAENAQLLSSGMGALSTAIMTFASAGDHVVAQTNLYAGTKTLLGSLLARFGVTCNFLEQSNPQAFAQAIRPNTKLIMVESPSNPLMTLTDLAAIAQIAQEKQILTLVDNTFATPINQRPIALGIDLVMHSATKFMGGHSDLLAGVVAGKTEHIEAIWKTSLILGTSINAFDSWLLTRGLRTLALRVKQSNQNALQLAQWLEAHPKIQQVYYPGLTSHPQHALAQRQMNGFSGMLSFQVQGDFAATNAFLSGLTMIPNTSSLGGFHSTIVHPAAMWAGSENDTDLAQRGILPNLLRLSVGIEDIEDIFADIEQALNAI